MASQATRTENGDGPFDVAVIGGGINGCGIARDAAGRGAKVLLLERGDLASGTSSASTKLIHGGLRYLEHYEFGLVREALRERETLWRIAPHIIHPLRFVLPHRRGLRPRWLLRAGLFLYDHLGGRRLLPPTRSIDLRRHPAGQPLKPGFAHGWEYSDGWVDDARLVLLNARDAADRGATILPRHRVVGAVRDGALWRIEAVREDGSRAEFSSCALINAAGPGVLDVLGLTKVKSRDRVRLVRGSHIVVKRLFAHDFAYFFQLPDTRIFFAIPYERDFTLIGTTDRDHDGGPVKASEEEIAYLCDGANDYFQQSISPSDVVWSYAGLRPLVDDGSGRPEGASRGYHFELDRDDGAPSLLSVFGGKITTYRRLAEEAVELLVPEISALTGPRWTGAAALPGGDFAVTGRAALAEALAVRHPFLDAQQAIRIASAYGTRASDWLGKAQRRNDLGEDFGGGLSAAEVDYCIDHEWARTADDMLWRRSKLGLRVTPDGVAALERPHGREDGDLSGDPMILVLDAGTSSVRALLYSAKGHVVATAQRETTQYYPQPGWVEHDPTEIWDRTLACAREVVAEVGGADRIAAIGIANQRETAVAWDKATGLPLARAIVWQDRRTADACALLREAGREPAVSAATGLVLDPYFSATKWRWMLDHVPAVADAGDRLALGTVESWLVWKLSDGTHVTDASNASRTLLLPLEGAGFDQGLCDLFDIPHASLPRVVDMAGMIAKCDPQWLGTVIPICGLAGDQQAAAIGQGCREVGSTKATFGSGAFILTATGAAPLRSSHRLLTTVLSQVEGVRHYAVEGSVFVAGSMIKWLRDGLGWIDHAHETEALARENDNGGVTVVPALAGLGAPYWRADVQGAIFGLTLGTRRAQIVRATLESISHQCHDLQRAFAADGAPWRSLRIDGGMSANDWLAQDLADILELPVERPVDVESTARGAAILAAVGIGLLPGLDNTSAFIPKMTCFAPTIPQSEIQARLRAWRDAVERLLKVA